MKRIIALLLALSMIFVFVACSAPCANHVDEDGDRICDTCKAEIPCAHTNKNGDFTCDDCGDAITNNGNLLSAALVSQLNDVKSFKLDLALEVTSETTVEITNPDAADYLPESGYSADLYEIKIEATRTADGGINAKISLSQKSKDTKGGSYGAAHGYDVYLIDGVVYTYDNDLEAYIAEELPMDVEQIEAALGELLAGVALTDEEKNVLYTNLGESIISTFKIADGKGSFYFDAKPVADKFIQYVKDFDIQNKTVRGLVDDVLGLIDEELTAAAILTELERIGALTVTAALAELDAWLTENYGTTLQGIYDTVVNDKNFEQIFSNAIALSAPEDVTPAQIAAEVERLLAALRAFKISDYLTQAGIGNMTVYDFGLALFIEMSGAPTEGAPTIDDFFDRINAYLDTKLIELGEDMEYQLTMIKSTFSMYTVNALNAKIDLGFEGLFKLASVDVAAVADISASSTVNGNSFTSSAVINATAKLHSLSKDAITIALPAGAEVLT